MTAPAAAGPASALRPLVIDVVSVQSQVVYGRVGNNVAVPALQAQGLAVAAVPTVVLSNTPHYPSIHGGALPVDWFQGYLSDLSARGALGQLRAVLTGYLGGPEQAQALGRWIGALVAERPALRVVVAPVLGDEDHGEYVAPGMADAYRRHLLPLADGLTPNGFELARLTDLPVGTFDDVVAAARTLLTDRTQWIAVTSAAPATLAPGEMQVALVTRTQAHPPSAHRRRAQGDGRFVCRQHDRTLAGRRQPAAGGGPGMSRGRAGAAHDPAGAIRRTGAAANGEPAGRVNTCSRKQMRHGPRSLARPCHAAGDERKPVSADFLTWAEPRLSNCLSWPGPAGRTGRRRGGRWRQGPPRPRRSACRRRSHPVRRS